MATILAKISFYVSFMFQKQCFRTNLRRIQKFVSEKNMSLTEVTFFSVCGLLTESRALKSQKSCEKFREINFTKNFVKMISRIFFPFDFELKLSLSLTILFLLIEHCVAEELIAIIIYVTSRYNHHQQQHRPKSWFVACYALIPCLWKRNYSLLNQLV